MTGFFVFFWFLTSLLSFLALLCQFDALTRHRGWLKVFLVLVLLLGPLVLILAAVLPYGFWGRLRGSMDRRLLRKIRTKLADPYQHYYDQREI